MWCWWRAPRAASAAWPSSSPRAPAPASWRPHSPRTRPSCASSASPTCCRATVTSPGSCATSSPTASTRCWTSSNAPGTYDAALKPDARIASPTGAAGEGPGRTYVMAAPSPENLQRLGALLADGTLRVHVQATYELAQAPEALAALPGEHIQGKLAIRVS